MAKIDKSISYDSFNKVLFLDKQKYNWNYIDIKNVGLSECPYERWDLYGASIKSKNRINSEDVPQRIAYQKIQQDFINGIYYDLKDNGFSCYGRVLMYDLRDAFHIGEDSLDEYLNKLDILICCMFGKEISSFLRPRVYNRITTIFELLDQCMRANELSSVKAIGNHFEDLPLTWAEYAASYMNASQEDIDILRTLGRFREGGFDNVWYNSIAGRVNGHGRVLREKAILLFVEVAHKTNGYDHYVQLAKEDKNFIKDDTCLFLLYQCASYVIQHYDVYDEGLMPYHKYEGKDEVILAFEKVLEGILMEYDKEVARVINDLYGTKHLYSAMTTIKDEYIRNENVIRFIVVFDYIIDFYINRTSGIREICLDAVRLIVDSDRFDALRYYFLSCILYDKTNVPLSKSIVEILFPYSQHQQKFSQLFEKNRGNYDYVELWNSLKGFYNESDCWQGPIGLLDEDYLIKIARINKFDKSKFDIKSVESYCETKKRTISIDDAVIKERMTTFEKTASNLSELLSEEDIADSVNLEVLSDNREKELIDLFVKEGCYLRRTQLDDFAREKGLLANALIDKINEIYFEVFEDNLIEESGDDWIMNKDYYEQIKTEEQ